MVNQDHRFLFIISWGLLALLWMLIYSTWGL